MNTPITVMIVDDEHLERVLISKSFAWEEAGMKITGYYESGSQAFAAFHNRQTDLVLTDISMPFMDGLELAGKMKQLCPATEIIIISGYDEFEYAKRGIHIGVMSYLLKPINRQELAETLQKAKAEILNRRRLEWENRSIRTDNFLQRLVVGRVGQKEFKEFTRQKGCSFLGGSILCAELAAQEGLWGLELLQHEAARLFQDSPHIAFIHYSGNAMLLLDGSIISMNVARERLTRMLKGTQRPFSGAVSETVVGEEGIERGFFQTKSALGILDIMQYCKVVCFHELKALSHQRRVSFQSFALFFSKAVKYGDEKAALVLLDSFLDDITISKDFAGYLKSDVLKIAITDVLSVLSVCIWEMGFSFSDTKRKESVYKTLSRQSMADDIRLELKELVRDCITFGSNAAKVHFPEILKKILSYLDKHYTDSTISLHRISNLFFINESYLSRIFKLYCGKTFLEHILQCRMERAKDLILTTQMRNYEIAEQVGIDDANYFGQCFKKYTGMTVNQFRRIQNISPK